jgi:hypothetical protein
MKLKTFDLTTCKGRRSLAPMISFNKTGVITLNAKLVAQLNLNPGDTLIFHQDEARKKDWYIEKNVLNGMTLRRYKGSKSMSLIMNASMVSKELLSSLNTEGPIKFPVANQTTEGKYYAILTAGFNGAKV